MTRSGRLKVTMNNKLIKDQFDALISDLLVYLQIPGNYELRPYDRDRVYKFAKQHNIEEIIDWSNYFLAKNLVAKLKNEIHPEYIEYKIVPEFIKNRLLNKVSEGDVKTVYSILSNAYVAAKKRISESDNTIYDYYAEDEQTIALQAYLVVTAFNSALEQLDRQSEWDETPITEETTDKDFGGYDLDAAYYVARLYRTDKDKVREFWVWWLEIVWGNTLKQYFISE